jgi:hypothetical protein
VAVGVVPSALSVESVDVPVDVLVAVPDWTVDRDASVPGSEHAVSDSKPATSTTILRQELRFMMAPRTRLAM